MSDFSAYSGAAAAFITSNCQVRSVQYNPVEACCQLTGCNATRQRCALMAGMDVGDDLHTLPCCTT